MRIFNQGALFMRLRGSILSILLLACVAACGFPEQLFADGEDNFYKLGPDSLPQDGVPKGKLVGPRSFRAMLTLARSTLIGFTCRRNTTRQNRPA